MSPSAVKGRRAGTPAAGILGSALRARKTTNVVSSGHAVIHAKATVTAALFDTSVQPMTPGGWILCFWIVSTANWSAAVFSLRKLVPGRLAVLVPDRAAVVPRACST
jgi:hypothetical protein